VAEDSRVNQQVVVGMLERSGHSAVVAGNGREALEALEKETFDLVLMDVQMPEMDGLAATAAIRRRERASGRRLPILAVTAHAGKRDAERCLAAGMDAHLSKPLQARELLAAIDAVLAGRPAVLPAASRPRGVLDRKQLLERVGNDRRALAAIVRTFLADYPRQLTRIRRALAAKDARALRDAAHALKGAVSNFAAPSATQAAQRLQQIGDHGDLAGASAASDHLERQLERVREALLAMGPGARAGARRPRHGR
jgi:CheY-like chemotaxis protein